MAIRRQRNLYSPQSKKSFRLSRSKIDLYLSCPRCFYLDRRLGISRPSLPSFNLNNAVDQLLKNEFDLYRQKQEPHPLMTQNKIEALPWTHPDLQDWRDDFHKYTGACFTEPQSNLEICGIVDDIWQNSKGELIIVDYKSTSTTRKISLEDKYKQAYKRQMEIYQWIFRKKGFTVSETGYFVFANATKNKDKFDSKLEFDMSILAYTGKTDWITPTILEIKDCLNQATIPSAHPECEYCEYRKEVYSSIVEKLRE